MSDGARLGAHGRYEAPVKPDGTDSPITPIEVQALAPRGTGTMANPAAPASPGNSFASAVD